MVTQSRLGFVIGVLVSHLRQLASVLGERRSCVSVLQDMPYTACDASKITIRKSIESCDMVEWNELGYFFPFYFLSNRTNA